MNKFYLLWLIVLASALVNAQTIPVKVIVECADPNISNTVMSNLQTELRKKTSVTTVNEDPLYVLMANILVLKSEDGNIIGVILSTVLTRKIELSPQVNKYEFVTSLMKSFEKEQIASKCSEIIDKFDVEYFDKDRNGTY